MAVLEAPLVRSGDIGLNLPRLSQVVPAEHNFERLVYQRDVRYDLFPHLMSRRRPSL